MKLIKNKELMTGFFFLLVTVVYSSQIPIIKRTKISPVNSAFLPLIISIGMGILTVCQLYCAYIDIKKRPLQQESVQMEQASDINRVICTLGCALVYVILFQPLGFVISSIAYLFAQMCVLAPKEERKPVLFFIVSVISVIAIYLLFYKGLRLMLPNGILTGIL